MLTQKKTSGWIQLPNHKTSSRLFGSEALHFSVLSTGMLKTPKISMKSKSEEVWEPKSLNNEAELPLGEQV